LTLIAVMVIATVAAATTLFTHTFPQVGPAVLTTTCATLTAGTPVLSTATGSVLYNCASSAAFNNPTSGTVTPTFTLPTVTGYTLSLGITQHIASTTTCGGTTSVTAIVSGTPITFGGAAVDDYCLSYTAGTGITVPPTIPSFTVTWSQ
jgi:hypothetical protein